MQSLPEKTFWYITRETEERAITLALTGKSQTKILQEMQIDVVTWWKYRRQNKQFANDFAQAIAEGQRSAVDKLDDICTEYPDVMQARLMSENIRWKASKLMPSVFGDRLDVNVTTVDLTGALEEAKRRALPVRDLNSEAALQIPETNANLQLPLAGLAPAARDAADAEAAHLHSERSARIEYNAPQSTANAPQNANAGVRVPPQRTAPAKPVSARLQERRILYTDLVATPDNADEVDIFS